MADRKAEPGAGDVPLMLGGEEFILKPSLEACRAITKMAGDSLNVAAARVGERLDFEFIVDVVALGIGATSPHLKKDVAQRIYQQGVISVAADVILYIRTIMNGGRRPDEDDSGRTLDLLDRLLAYVPEGLEEQAKALLPFRDALVERIAEAGEEPADPLPVNPSRLETISGS